MWWWIAGCCSEMLLAVNMTPGLLMICVPESLKQIWKTTSRPWLKTFDCKNCHSGFCKSWLKNFTGMWTLGPISRCRWRDKRTTFACGKCEASLHSECFKHFHGQWNLNDELWSSVCSNLLKLFYETLPIINTLWSPIAPRSVHGPAECCTVV